MVEPTWWLVGGVAVVGAAGWFNYFLLRKDYAEMTETAEAAQGLAEKPGTSAGPFHPI